MITLLAAITGFISSIFPDILKIIRDKNDKAHELKLFDKQVELQKLGLSNRLEEIGAMADAHEVRALYSSYKTGINWVDALNGTVRPVIAYAFFFLYASIKYLQFSAISSGAPLYIYLDILWVEDDQAIFAGIISFYYGQRALFKMRRA